MKTIPLAVLESSDFFTLALIVFFVVLFVSILTRQQVNLSRLERKLDALLAHHQIQLGKLSPEVQRMAKDPSQKIAAIKLHRDQNPGMSLMEAKMDVENIGKTP